MAISKRNPFPMAIAILGLAMFFYFGFGSKRQLDTSTSPPVEPQVDALDPASIDAIAARAANDADELIEPAAGRSNLRDKPDRSDKPSERLLAVDDPENQRLDLSGAAIGASDRTTGNAGQLKSYNGLYDLTFDDVKFDLEPDEPFTADKLTDAIRQIDGQRIKIRGYIRPSFSQRGLKSFVFVRDNKECCFGPNAAIYDCMLVKLKKETTTDYTVRPVVIEGTFYLKPYQGPDGNTWAIYRMRNASVK